MKDYMMEWVLPVVMIIMFILFLWFVFCGGDVTKQDIADSIDRHSNSQRGWQDEHGHSVEVYRERNER